MSNTAIVVAIVIPVIFLIRFLWKSYTHPANTLGRQAANMGWIASGRIEDKHGFKNVSYSRDGMEAMVSFKEGIVYLLDGTPSNTFSDFVELERWLAQGQRSDDLTNISLGDAAGNEVQQTLRALDDFGQRHEDFLFFDILKKHVTGIVVGESEKTISSIREEGLTPEQLVYLLSTNAIQRFLPTGGFFTYRGTLNMQGHEMLRLWDIAVDGMEATGLQSAEESAEDKQWIRDQIKNWG